MYRIDFILVGCILIVVGSCLSIVGYNKLQPNGVDQAVGLFEQLSGEQAPRELKSSKSEGYAFLGGLGFILSCRRSMSGSDANKRGR